MQKTRTLLFGMLGLTSVAAVAVCTLSSTKPLKLFGDTPQSVITIDSLAEATELDGNQYWKQLSVRNNLFDFLGVAEGNAITISQRNYGVGYTYKGLVYNRSMINGFNSLTVDYSGSDLYVSFSEYLMEDMTFPETAAHLVTSESTITITDENCGYFVLYTSGTTTISSIEVKYSCDASLDASLLYDSSTIHGYARSAAKVHDINHDLINLENNPLTTTNNYSSGSHGGHPDAWYRWNGIDLPATDEIGHYFSIHTTIIGNISYMVDSSKYFNYSVWPEVNQKGTASSNGWSYAFIGNDNYEPLGKDNPGRIITDTYADYSYAGRFFTKYDPSLGWEFADPDVSTTLEENSTTTLRDAYEAFTLPFWHVEIRILGNFYQTYINGFFVDECDLLDESEYDPDKPFYIKRLDLHLVNYGNTDRSPKESYTGTFTTPRYKILSKSFENGTTYLVGSKNFFTGEATKGASWNDAFRALEFKEIDNGDLKKQEKVTVTFAAGDEWRIREGTNYATPYIETGGAIDKLQMHISGDNIVVDEDGTYDIYFKTGYDDGHSVYIAPEANSKVLSFQAQSSISNDGGWIAVWAWKGTGNGKLYFGRYSGDIVKITVPSDLTNCKVLRMASGVDAGELDRDTYPSKDNNGYWNDSDSIDITTQLSYTTWLNNGIVQTYAQ